MTAMAGITPWPAALARRYRDEGLWQDRTLGDHFSEWAGKWERRTALVAATHEYTYGELAGLSDGLASRLLGLGLKSGDRLVVQLPNIAEFALLVLALFRIGVIPVMALPAHRQHEIEYLVRHSGAVAYAIPSTFAGFDFRSLARDVRGEAPALKHVLVVGDEVAPEFIDLGALLAAGPASAEETAELDQISLDPDSVALFLLSGGTTGLPKLIPRSHNDYAYNILQSARVCAFDADTVYLAALPVSHNFPFGCPGILGTFANGGRVVLAASPRPEVALPLMNEERVTVTSVVPAIAIIWMDYVEKSGTRPETLEVLQVGGARLNPEAARRIAPVLGCRLQQVFGMAEGLLNYTRLDDEDSIIIGTQGRPMSPADEVRIVDPAGKDVAPGEAGELLTRGPYTLRGYYRADAHNRKAFTGDGFFRTGDIVRADAMGNLSVEGRDKDIINRGGEKISAEEIENLVLAHPAVANVAVVAMPDAVLGERICVFVELKGDLPIDLDQLREFLEARKIARFKLPERLEILPALPLTAVGKVDKKGLREKIAAQL